MCKQSLSHELLLLALAYDPNTGIFKWKKRCGRSAKGNIAGSKAIHGYIQITFCGFNYLAHRLAWFYINNEWPDGQKGQIDHINGIRDDNRLVNLRVVSSKENAQNKRNGSRINTACGLMGVRKNRKRWSASITSSGKNFHIGTFDTPEEAHKAYIEVKRKLHKTCTI